MLRSESKTLNSIMSRFYPILAITTSVSLLFAIISTTTYIFSHSTLISFIISLTITTPILYQAMRLIIKQISIDLFITNSELVYLRGTRDNRQIIIPLDTIVNLIYDISLLEMILGYGTLTIVTTTGRIVLEDIPLPILTSQKIQRGLLRMKIAEKRPHQNL